MGTDSKMNSEVHEIRQCELNVIKTLKTSPRVKLLVQALTKSGCPLIPNRHIACIHCHQAISGGYDDINNQVIICANKCQNESKVEEITMSMLLNRC